jgi:hypothetical protein
MSSVQELRAALRPPATPAKAAEADTAPAEADKAPAEADKAPVQRSSAAIGMLVLAAAVGIGVGIALDRFVLPHGSQPPAPAAAVVAPQAAGESADNATGTIIQPDANNPLQRGSGGVSVAEGAVVLGADFAVTPGPDYRVLLVPKPAIRAAADLGKTMYVDLGPLAAFQGSQSYAVPAGVELAKYPSVVIWCAPYAALISSADLSFGGAGD